MRGRKYAVLEDCALDTTKHDRPLFDCGVDSLNLYLRSLAEQHRRKGIGVTYVLTNSTHPREILGFYTLSAAEVDIAELSELDRKKLPRHPVPCFRLARLACDKRQRSLGLGKLLLGCAVDRCLQARAHVAAYALVVDAKHDNAKGFYKHFGFIEYSSSPMALYLPLGGAVK